MPNTFRPSQALLVAVQHTLAYQMRCDGAALTRGCDEATGRGRVS